MESHESAHRWEPCCTDNPHATCDVCERRGAAAIEFVEKLDVVTNRKRIDLAAGKVVEDFFGGNDFDGARAEPGKVVTPKRRQAGGGIPE